MGHLIKFDGNMYEAALKNIENNIAITNDAEHLYKLHYCFALLYTSEDQTDFSEKIKFLKYNLNGSHEPINKISTKINNTKYAKEEEEEEEEAEAYEEEEEDEDEDEEDEEDEDEEEAEAYEEEEEDEDEDEEDEEDEDEEDYSNMPEL
jgi:hypothetical protein